jgi:hypothetical protein
MKRILVVRIVLFAVMAAALAVAVVDSESSTRAQASACRCPLIYAPVVCDNGKTYPNQCVANCHHAKGCVPSGG